MEFRISDTFTASLAKLNGDEQKAVKTTAFDLQMDPSGAGMQFHKLDRAKDKNFWSVRVSRDIRLIVHKSDASLLLCYVDHHDNAYAWAARRKIVTHPTTGAAQLVEVRETVKEITVPVYVEAPTPVPSKPPLFADITDEALLGYGVPEEWLADAKAATEETLFEVANHLPTEAAEALLNLAVGETPQVTTAAANVADPFDHPDAKRRFRVVGSTEELARALDYPWEKWAVFLHPAQREMVRAKFNGPARVAGSAGTGKTVVALHRAAYLAEANRDARVLVTTFSDPLAAALREKLRFLIGNSPRVFERIEVDAIKTVGKRLYEARFGAIRFATEAEQRTQLGAAAADAGAESFTDQFLWTEWRDVVDAWQLNDWESYRDVKRLGRKTRLPESQRRTLWEVISVVRDRLAEQGSLTSAMMFGRLAARLRTEGSGPYGFIVVDEAQDIGVPELRFLSALCGEEPASLFFAGDLGQRIFQPPFSWKSLGVDIRGRSRTLRINYRTSHQIRSQADRLLPPEISDVDGASEQRKGTVSAFEGPDPVVQVFDTQDAEEASIASWLRGCESAGVRREEIAVFVRSQELIDRSVRAVEAAGQPVNRVEEGIQTVPGHVSVMTMHQAKGLEFRCVAVMACDDDQLPSLERIEAIGDEADLEEVYSTERHLLYVACTRARDRLMVTGVDPASEFLDDLLGN
ncbi:Putative ATP-dependent DNA helicase YjcD [Planctomycetes bacterium MalM25]|nr:Putative ATP-dependent DNA helicase YjcD [Planctomycetes bacterium MalM25]